MQAFPDANHYVERLDKEDPFKIIYGVEAYLVDDLTEIAVNEQGQTLDDTFVVFDIETTGFGAAEDRIIEIGAVKITDGAIVDRFSTFVNPEVPIPFEIQQLTHITDDMVLEAPKIEEHFRHFLILSVSLRLWRTMQDLMWDLLSRTVSDLEEAGHLPRWTLWDLPVYCFQPCPNIS